MFTHHFDPYSPGESWDSMRERLPVAIADVYESPSDLSCINMKHVFDFEGGYRMHVTRDRCEGREFIVATFGIADGCFIPAPLMCSKAAVHFAELTDNSYGQPEVLCIEPGMVSLGYEAE